MYISDTRILVSIQIERKLSSPPDSLEGGMRIHMVTTVLFSLIKAILVTRVTTGGHNDSVQVLQNISILYIKCLNNTVCILVLYLFICYSHFFFMFQVSPIDILSSEISKTGSHSLNPSPVFTVNWLWSAMELHTRNTS